MGLKFTRSWTLSRRLPLKSDQNGIEISPTQTQSHHNNELKSDQNGIEIDDDLLKELLLEIG